MTATIGASHHDSCDHTSVQDVNEAIQDTVSLLRVPRPLLNICCSSRGAVSGPLQIQEKPEAPWQDCQASGWKALPGDCNAILNYRFLSSAQYILVIEKDVSCCCNAVPLLVPTTASAPKTLFQQQGNHDSSAQALCSERLDCCVQQQG